MTATKCFVETLSFETMLEMVKDYKDYETKCYTGDTELRRQTEKFLKEANIPDTNTAIWMQLLMFDVYANLADRYIKICSLSIVEND